MRWQWAIPIILFGDSTYDDAGPFGNVATSEPQEDAGA
jgi:hypothetical protein